MASEGTDSVSIARSLEISERTVRYAVRMFNDVRCQTVRSTPPGRPRAISDSQHESLIAIIRCSPTEFGIQSERWNPAEIIVVARNEELLRDLSYWTIRREIARLINLDSELRNRVNVPDQKQPGAPPGNRNAVRHGAYVSSGPSTEERAIIEGIEARFLRDFPGSGKDDTRLIRDVAEACLTLNRGLGAGSADATLRADRRFRNAIKALKTKGKRQTDEPKITPAEWTADLLKRFREG